MGSPIKSAGGDDDKVIGKEPTQAEQYPEKIKVEGNVDERREVSGLLQNCPLEMGRVRISNGDVD